MKLFTSLFVALTVTSVFGIDEVFPSFTGTYQIESRQCRDNDNDCLNLEAIEIGAMIKDGQPGESTLTEIFKGGGRRIYILWEGSVGEASEAFTSGTAGFEAGWVRRARVGDTFEEEHIKLWRFDATAPIFYGYGLYRQFPTSQEHIDRNFTLRRMP